MPHVRRDHWVPVGVAFLEPTAEQVVRSEQNTLVVAGPGAGKTELLAQRACFLLDTRTCPAPGRILAISFKRDAAKNLHERVCVRSGDRGRRFDSYTLDAFAKSLVDRFRLALPEDWQPKSGYEIMARSLPVNEMRAWIAAAGRPPGHPQLNLQQRSDTDIRLVFDSFCHGFPLPYDDEEIDPLVAYLGRRWWNEQLGRPEGQPSLTFPMLSRLAAFVLRHNAKVTAALRATYGFVFLDEFQDTTASQYELVRAAFQGSASVLTAVGDSKQRIMVWAGAMLEVFEAYQTDFSAERHYLISNYRSAPELVRMQHVIAQALEAGTPAATATKTNSSGSCILLEFSNQEDEAVYLAELIDRGIRSEGKKARDFCLLVRQRPGDMIEPLKTALARRGIQIRDESQLQDLLAEPVVKFLIMVLRLATRTRDAEAWESLTNEVAVLLGLDGHEDVSRIEQGAKQLLEHARRTLSSGSAVTTLPTELIAMVGDSAFRSFYRQYGRGSFLSDIITRFAEELEASLTTAGSAREAVNEIIGVDVVPAMTIHKSKGLEFHTVIFLGLEDSQWWAFSSQADEEKRGFFVAFSRAAERVYFTFSDVRNERWGRRQQRKAQIGDLYTILQQAGVSTVNHRRQSA